MKSNYVAYVLLFLAGLWGGNELVKLFSNEEAITAAAKHNAISMPANFPCTTYRAKPINSVNGMARFGY
jgi:hypothetical protein